MGVYIPNWKMPPTCGACAFFIPNIHDRGDDSICPLAICETRADCKKPSYCPLVEVKPHGRLIDADALRNEWIWGTTDRLGYTKCVEVIDIDNAPTIIEAEGEE